MHMHMFVCDSNIYRSSVNRAGRNSWHSETDECVRSDGSVPGRRSPTRLTHLRFFRHSNLSHVFCKISGPLFFITVFGTMTLSAICSRFVLLNSCRKCRHHTTRVIDFAKETHVYNQQCSIYYVSEVKYMFSHFLFTTGLIFLY